MIHIFDFPFVTIREWQKFQKDLPRSLIAEVIDRAAVELPDHFLPFARGIAIASEELLSKTRIYQRLNYMDGWRRAKTGDWSREAGLHLLLVRQVADQGLWTCERWVDPWDHTLSDDILAHAFGSTPILTRSPEAAIQLTSYCDRFGPPPGLCWASAVPRDHKAATEIARRLHMHEAVEQSNSCLA
jgi:hypothetical protein